MSAKEWVAFLVAACGAFALALALAGATMLLVWRLFLRPFGQLIGAFVLVLVLSGCTNPLSPTERAEARCGVPLESGCWTACPADRPVSTPGSFQGGRVCE